MFGIGAAGVASGAALGGAVAHHSVGISAANSELQYDFYGEHQAGIVTPVQEQMHFAAFDLAPDLSRADFIELLQDWTAAISRITAGLDVTESGAFGGSPFAPPDDTPDDTGEATGIAPAGLTVTVGFGKTVFDHPTAGDRFSLSAKMPREFTDLPRMRNDFLRPEYSDGDICVQACANDPQVALHAIRNLSKIAFGRAVIRWSQLGFGRSSITSRDQSTPRNLFGLKDGTANIFADQKAELQHHVWIGDSSSQAWAAGGSYLVARRINMLIEVWDSAQLAEQERVIGRDKREGAPLSGGGEFTKPDFSALDSSGEPKIDERSHLFRVHPEQNSGIRMLRRSYNFIDGNDEQGLLNAGLFFIAFVNEPDRFATVHKNMARDDLLTEYLKTTGSAVFLILPGIKPGQYLGQQLFA